MTLCQRHTFLILLQPQQMTWGNWGNVVLYNWGKIDLLSLSIRINQTFSRYVQSRKPNPILFMVQDPREVEFASVVNYTLAWASLYLFRRLFLSFEDLFSSFCGSFHRLFKSLKSILCGCVSFVGWQLSHPQIPLRGGTSPNLARNGLNLMVWISRLEF